MKTVHLVRYGCALCLAIVPSTAVLAEGVADPAPIVSAFNDTCRRGFPDLRVIRERAESLGWVSLSGRLVEPLSDPRLRPTDVPDILFDGEMTLILTAPNPVWNRWNCTISVPADNALDTRALARAVSFALDGAEASVAENRGVEVATWRVKAGFRVTASVGKSGDKRRAHLAVLTD